MRGREFRRELPIRGISIIRDHSISAPTRGVTTPASSPWPKKRSPRTAPARPSNRSPGPPGSVRRRYAGISPPAGALPEAVSRERIEALRLRAAVLAGVDDSRSALLEWLSDLVDYCVSARGPAAALSYGGGAAADPVHANTCAASMREAVEPLVRRAARDGAVAAGTTAGDLITLVVGISLATEHFPDPAAEADRLFRLTVAGLSP